MPLSPAFRATLHGHVFKLQRLSESQDNLTNVSATKIDTSQHGLRLPPRSVIKINLALVVVEAALLIQLLSRG
jgi:hypothetical protein